jgi:transcriptional regulator with XRE-family HTH domain
MATQRKDQGKAWAEGLHRRIAATIRQARTREGMSAQDVADATQELGYALSRDKIANYESGRKQGLDIAEFLVIAAALRMPPISLLFDGPPDEPVQVLPGDNATMADGLAWLSADTNIAEDAVVEPDSYYAKLLDLIRERARAERDLRLARKVVADFERRGIEEYRESDLYVAGRLIEQIDEINQQITKLVEGEEE